MIKKKCLLLIKREPQYYKNVPDYQYAMCAATANKLANDYLTEVPGLGMEGQVLFKGNVLWRYTEKQA